MVSLATLVLTITMVVVQLAMGQFSPRIVETFLRDKPSQLAIGLFVATFAHAMVAIREVQSDEDGRCRASRSVAFVLVIISIVMLVIYVHHIGSRPGLIVDRTRRNRHAAAAGRAVSRIGSTATTRGRTMPERLWVPKSGVLVSIDRGPSGGAGRRR